MGFKQLQHLVATKQKWEKKWRGSEYFAVRHLDVNTILFFLSHAVFVIETAVSSVKVAENPS